MEDLHRIPLNHITNTCIIEKTSTLQLNFLFNLFYNPVILLQSKWQHVQLCHMLGFVQQKKKASNYLLSIVKSKVYKHVWIFEEKQTNKQNKP